MDKMKTRMWIVPLLCMLLAIPLQMAHAQGSPAATQIVVGGPAQADLGSSITVQALLVDSQGNPLPNELISFTTKETFMGKSGDVILAQATTNASGQAVAQIVNDVSGSFELNAVFSGNDQYAASTATTSIAMVGDQQVYAENVGVDIPGLNVPPVSAPMAAVYSSRPGIVQILRGLWPAANGWPVAAVLGLVWAMYFVVATFIFRVASPARKTPQTTETGSTRYPDPWRAP